MKITKFKQLQDLVLHKKDLEVTLKQIIQDIELLEEEIFDYMEQQDLSEQTFDGEGITVKKSKDYRGSMKTVLQSLDDPENNSEEILSFLQSLKEDGIAKNNLIINLNNGKSDINYKVFEAVNNALSNEEFEDFTSVIRTEIHHKTLSAFLRKKLEDEECSEKTRIELIDLFNVTVKKRVNILKSKKGRNISTEGKL